MAEDVILPSSDKTTEKGGDLVVAGLFSTAVSAFAASKAGSAERKAAEAQLRALEIQFPQEMQDFIKQTGATGQNIMSEAFGGEKVSGFDFTPEMREQFLANNPEFAQSLEGAGTPEASTQRINEMQQQLNILKGQDLTGTNPQVQQQVAALEQEMQQAQGIGQQVQDREAEMLRAFAGQQEGVRFNTETGQLESFETIEGIDPSTDVYQDERLPGLSDALYQQIGTQVPSQTDTLSELLRTSQGITGGQEAALQDISGGLSSASDLQSALLGQAQAQAPGAFQDASALATQFGAGFQPGYGNQFQSAVEQSLTQAQGMGDLAQRQADDLIAANAEEYEVQKQGAIDDALDALAAQGISGSGMEREVINSIKQNYDRKQRADATNIRMNAKQQSFQNMLNAQGSVASLAQAGSGLRGQRLGQDVGAAEAGVGFTERGGQLGLQGLQTALGLGRDVGQSQAATAGLRASLEGQIGDVGRAQAGQRAGIRTEMGMLPENVLRQQMAELQAEEARRRGISAEEYERKFGVKGQLISALAPIQNQAAQAAQSNVGAASAIANQAARDREAAGAALAGSTSNLAQAVGNAYDNRQQGGGGGGMNYPIDPYSTQQGYGTVYRP